MAKTKALTLILLSILALATFSFLTTTATSGSIEARVVFNTQPTPNWLLPQMYTATVQIRNNGIVSLPDDDTTDNLVPTGNVSVDVRLTTVAMKPGLTVDVSGSVIETEIYMFGSLLDTVNGSASSGNVPLPQDSQWHDVLTLKCYYDVPSLPFPKEELTKIQLSFNFKATVELGEIDSSATPDPSTGVGMKITVTYEGKNIGNSNYEYTLLEQEPAQPTIQPTVDPTQFSSTPHPTVTPSTPQGSPTTSSDRTTENSLLGIPTTYLIVGIAAILVIVVLVIAVVAIKRTK